MTVQRATKRLKTFLADRQKLADDLKETYKDWQSDIGRQLAESLERFFQSDVANLRFILDELKTKRTRSQRR